MLRDVSVVVTPGQMLAVTGPSGAGKTTLLWAMAGLLRPVGGTVTVDGTSLRDRDHAVAEQVVLIPQDNGLAAILTAQENIQVAMIAGGVTAGRRPAGDRRRRWSGSASPARPTSWSRSSPAASSSAPRSPAGLALHGDVLLADEVTSELDAHQPAAGHGAAAGGGPPRRGGRLRHPRPGGRRGLRRASCTCPTACPTVR